VSRQLTPINPVNLNLQICQNGNTGFKGKVILYSDNKTRLSPKKQSTNRRNVMIISDLNYLEDAHQEIVGGWAVAPTYSFVKNVSATDTAVYSITGSSNITDTLKKTASYSASACVTNNSGSIAFTNEAIGANTNTQSSFSQLVTSGSSNQSGMIVALVSP
jgi:hypothetical protein